MRAASFARCSWPRTVTTRPGTPMPSIGTKPSCPTASATRYEGSGLVCAKRTSFQPFRSGPAVSGVFETASKPAGISTVSW